MTYSIIKLYTEKLDISSFKFGINNEKIETFVKFNVSFMPINDNKNSTFIMEYTVRGVNKPISLNWVGIDILDSSSDELNKDILLNDEKIKNFISESIEKFSFFLGGKLPDIYKQIEENND